MESLDSKVYHACTTLDSNTGDSGRAQYKQGCARAQPSEHATFRLPSCLYVYTPHKCFSYDKHGTTDASANLCGQVQASKDVLCWQKFAAARQPVQNCIQVHKAGWIHKRASGTLQCCIVSFALSRQDLSSGAASYGAAVDMHSQVL